MGGNVAGRREGKQGVGKKLGEEWSPSYDNW